MIAAASESDLPSIALLMASSTLVKRYGITHDSALKSLSTALGGGDLILVSRSPSADGLAWLSFAPTVLGGAAYLHLLIAANPGRGVGSQLLAAAEDQAWRRANHLYLLATTDNLGARRFYERHGYHHIGDLQGLVRPELDEALYHKALRAYGERL
jgi:GNAT superfamily N-acetyltransferase